jgi:hypothetical protein
VQASTITILRYRDWSLLISSSLSMFQAQSEKMADQKKIQLRLITDMDSTIEHHCSLCLYFHDAQNTQCLHRNNATLKASRSPASTSSYYTAETSSSNGEQAVQSAIRAKVWASPAPSRPTLRHRTPTQGVSLRELRARQSQQSILRAKESEEKLQQAYEAQILAYLQSPLADPNASKR